MSLSTPSCTGTETLSLVITNDSTSIKDTRGKLHPLDLRVVEARNSEGFIQILGEFKEELGRGIPNPERYGKIKLYKEENGELEDWTALLTDLAQKTLLDFALRPQALESDFIKICHGVHALAVLQLFSIPLDSYDGPRPGEWLLIRNTELDASGRSTKTPRAILHLRDGICLCTHMENIPLFCTIESIKEQCELDTVERLVRPHSINVLYIPDKLPDFRFDTATLSNTKKVRGT